MDHHREFENNPISWNWRFRLHPAHTSPPPLRPPPPGTCRNVSRALLPINEVERRARMVLSSQGGRRDLWASSELGVEQRKVSEWAAGAVEVHSEGKLAGTAQKLDVRVNAELPRLRSHDDNEEG